MRDTIARLVEETHQYGFSEDQFFTDFFMAVMMSFDVEDAPGPIRFAPDSRFVCIFAILESEGYISRLPNSTNESDLGTDTHNLTQSGVYLAYECARKMSRRH